MRKAVHGDLDELIRWPNSMSENDYESIDNLRLIQDNLHHIRYEMSLPEPSLFRIARESHQVLLRSMVEALKGTANFNVTGRKKSQYIYKTGDDPFKLIRKGEILPDCQHAWRYTEPEVVDPPPTTCKDSKGSESRRNRNDRLLDFFDLLAMIQTECCMLQYCMSQTIRVTDEEMKVIDWLHRKVRNEFEHFIPKGYLVECKSSKNAAEICLRLSYHLLFESGNVLFSGGRASLEQEFNEALDCLAQIAT